MQVDFLLQIRHFWGLDEIFPNVNFKGEQLL